MEIPDDTSVEECPPIAQDLGSGGVANPRPLITGWLPEANQDADAAGWAAPPEGPTGSDAGGSTP